MGDSFQILVDRDASADEAPRLAAEVRDWLVARRIIEGGLTDSALGDLGHRPGLGYRAAVAGPDEEPGFLSLLTNGLQIEVGRTVFHTIGGELACRACGARFEPEDGWSEAVDDWYSGNDGAEFGCPNCGKPERLVDWNGEFPWGFGNLGFKFWNWPPLSGRFIQDMAEKLGHRMLLVRGHL